MPTAVCILRLSWMQAERSMKTRITEHKRAVSMFAHDSKISCHAHELYHLMDFEGVRLVGHDANFHEWLFVEVWFSIKDPQSGNDHIAIPKDCKSVARPTFSRNVTRTFSKRAFDVLFFVIWTLHYTRYFSVPLKPLIKRENHLNVWLTFTIFVRKFQLSFIFHPSY